MECSKQICQILWPNISFKTAVSLLVFCLDDEPIDVSRVSKSHYCAALKFFLSFFYNCLIYFVAPIVAYVFITIMSPLSLYIAYLSVLLFYLAWNSCCLLYMWLHLLFLSAICLKYNLLSIHFEPMFVLRAEMSLLEKAYSWALFLNPSRLPYLPPEKSVCRSRSNS